MFAWVVTGLGMIAVGWLVWTMLKAQGPATPPTDTPQADENSDSRC
ncbi:MAG: hypothetical protein VX527_12260 [Planctomycetota bacterium]|nr:hypothetical protein [Planctomycetota bacterium]